MNSCDFRVFLQEFGTTESGIDGAAAGAGASDAPGAV